MCAQCFAQSAEGFSTSPLRSFGQVSAVPTSGTEPRQERTTDLSPREPLPPEGCYAARRAWRCSRFFFGEEELGCVPTKTSALEFDDQPLYPDAQQPNPTAH
jgi:hypothetical protein